MSEFLAFLRNDLASALAILSFVVFVHEMGHFLVARWCGVTIEVFSIGFGPEIIGWTAKNGTRWRLSLLPIGGYVKMLGDLNAASQPDPNAPALPPEQLARSFPGKTVGQRAAIVAAGPLANLLLGLGLLSGLFMTFGQVITLPEVGEVVADLPAARAGLQTGDRVISVNGQPVSRFQDVQTQIRLNTGESLSLEINRDGRLFGVVLQPQIREQKDMFGNVFKVPMIGVTSRAGATTVVQHGPVQAVVAAGQQIHEMVRVSLQAMGQMLTGRRSTEDLRGPITIVKNAGQAARHGVDGVMNFVIMLTVSLGMLNLFPVPMLDGGHLLFYAVEAIMGRPMSIRLQEYGFRAGIFLVLALMILATWNDLFR